MSKMNLRICAGFVIALIFYQHAESQTSDVWTLQRCFEHARQHNIIIKKSELAVEGARANVTQAWAGLFPTLNGSVAESFNFGLRFDPTTGLLNDQRFTTSSISANSQFIIFNGLTNYYSISQAKHTYKASQFDFQQAIDDVYLNIVNLYMQLLFAQERLEIVKQQADLLRQQVARTRELHEAGTVNKGTLLSIEAQLATQELTQVNGENALANAKLALIQLLNLESFDMQIEKPDFSTALIQPFNENESAQGVYLTALTLRPNIMGREFRAKAARKALAAARGSYYPQLAFNASVSTIYSGLLKQNPFDPNSPVVPFFDQLQRNNAQQLSFGLSIPIFNGLQVRTAVKQSKLSYQNAQLDLQNEQMALRNTIQQVWADARAAYKTYEANRKNLTALEENYQYAQQRFDANMINSVDYNDAMVRFFNARTELLIAQYDYVFKTKVLDFYKGKKIEF